MPKTIKKTKPDSDTAQQNPEISSKAISFDKWIAIGNLFLTLIVGIGMAIYLNIRNEQFQIQLMELQKTADKNSKLATIRVMPICYFVDDYFSCNGKFYIENIGQAPAEDLNISITFAYIGSEWIDSIIDIGQFGVSVDKSSLDYVVENKTVPSSNNYSYDLSDFSGNNVKTIRIGKLSPDSKLEFTLTASQGFPGKIIKEATEVEVKVGLQDPNNMDMSDWNLDRIFTVFWNSFYHDKEIAAFEIDTNCNNCVESSEPVRVYKFPFISFDFISSAITFLEIDPSSKHYESNGTLFYTCLVPEKSTKTCLEKSYSAVLWYLSDGSTTVGISP